MNLVSTEDACVVDVVYNTVDIVPAVVAKGLARSQLGIDDRKLLREAVDGGKINTRRASHVSVSRIRGTVDDVDTPRKLASNVTCNSFIDKLLSEWCVQRAVDSGGVLVYSGKRWAKLDSASGVSYTTLVDSIGKHLLIPSVEEISVEPVASGVTVSKDEATTITGVDIVDIIVHLEEEMHEELRVSGRAGTVVDLAEVSHVAAIFLVKIDAIPAGWELNLCAHTVLTDLVTLRGRYAGSSGPDVKSHVGCLWDLKITAVVRNADETGTIRNGTRREGGVTPGHGSVVV